MAWSILFIAMLFFAVRGFFLGLAGVIAKLLGIIGGYFCAIFYRTELAAMINTHIPNSLPDMVLHVISGAVLFFSAMLLISILTAMMFKTLGRIIPPLQPLFDKQSLTGKLAGAISNSFVAVAIVLTSIWALTAYTGKSYAPEPLQSAANKFGRTLFNSVIEHKGFTVLTLQQTSLTNRAVTYQYNRGSATIISASNPEKKLSINTTQDTVGAIEPATRDPGRSEKLGHLMQNQTVQEFLSNPEIRNSILKQLKDNPEALKSALENVNLQQIIEQIKAIK